MVYRDIPSTPACVKGCADCCGPVPWSAEERLRIEGDIPADAEWIKISGGEALSDPKTNRCPFVLSGGGCGVYDRRPFMCRLFGAADTALMICPHGCNAKRPMSEAAAITLFARYTRGGMS